MNKKNLVLTGKGEKSNSVKNGFGAVSAAIENMLTEKKSLVLFSKILLLVALIGFCLPMFKSDNGIGNGFAPIVSVLSQGPADLAKAKADLKEYEDKNADLAAELAEEKLALSDTFGEIKDEFKAEKAQLKLDRKQAREYKSDIKDFNKEIAAYDEEIYSIIDKYESDDGEISLDENGFPTNLTDEDSLRIDELLDKEDELAVEREIEEKEQFIAGVETSSVRSLRRIKNKNLRDVWGSYKEDYSEYGDEHNVLLAKKKNAKWEILIPIALIVFACSLIVSIALTTIHYVVLKKSDYNRVHTFIDVLLYILILASGFYAFTKITKINTEVLANVTYTFGYYIVIVGVVISFIAYLFSLTLDENISSAQEERRAYWMLSLPAIFFYFAVMTFPSFFSVFLSFTDYQGGVLFEKFSMFFIGFDNYVDVFKDSMFYLSLKNNLYIVLISVFGQLPLGFLLAYVLNRGLVKGRDFFQTMIYLPCVISTVVIGILFQAFFSSSGAWTDLMKVFNPAYKWSMNNRPMIPVLVVILWMYTGTYLIIFLANLQKLDPEIIEAATIDGATEGQVLWNIIFPELSGSFVISAILAISGSLKSFDLIYVMTAGGPAKQTYVLSLYMFDKAFKGAADYPIANTISTVMVVISLVLIAIVKTLEKKFGASDED